MRADVQVTAEPSKRPTLLLLRMPRLSASIVKVVLNTPNVIGFLGDPPSALNQSDFRELRSDADDVGPYEEESTEIDEATRRVLSGASWARSQRRLAIVMLIFTALLFALFAGVHWK